MTNTITPPSHVVLELEEGDVHKDLVEIIDSMDAIRREQILTNSMSDEKKNEYLHLAFRLASAAEALATPELRERMNSILKAIEENPALLTYDFLQDKFWHELIPQFTTDLDKLLIHLNGDDFSSIGDTHHLLNAMKYLGSQSEPLERRIVIYDTILPYNAPLNEHSRELFAKELKKRGISKSGAEDLALKAQISDIRSLERFMEIAAALGFTRLKTEIPEDNLKNIEERYHIITIKKIGEQKEKEEDYQLKPKEPANSQGKKNTKSKLRYILKPLYPVLGTLPEGLRQSIEDKGGKENFDTATAFQASVVTEIIGGVATASAGVGAYAATDQFIWAAASVCGIYSMVQGFVRGIISSDGDERGSLHGCILGSPYYLYRWIKGKKKRNEKNEREGKYKQEEKILPGKIGNLVVELQVPANDDLKYNTRKAEGWVKESNLHPVMEDIAAKNLSEDAEKSLIWALENHNTQGKLFSSELLGTPVEENREKNLIPSNKHFERALGVLTFYNAFETGRWRKVSALVCMPGKRYAITFVSPAKEDTKLDIEALAKELGSATNGNSATSNHKGNERAKRIFELVGAEYMHFSEYDAGRKVEDITATATRSPK